MKKAGTRAGRFRQLRRNWTETFRHAPIGILAIGALLLFMGAGLLIGGAFFAFSGRLQSGAAWLLTLAVGPLAIYVALRLVALRRRAWAVVVLLLGLLAVSAAVRAVRMPGPPLAPLGELALEALGLGYLLRPRIRRAFTD